MIRKEGNEYFVYSEQGKKLSKGYPSKEEASKRLQTIEYFKHNDDETLTKLMDGEDEEQGQYNDEDVSLNRPFLTPDKKTKYAVYSKNANMDTVLLRFSGEESNIKSNDKSTPSYWNNKLSKSSFTDFKMMCFFDAATKHILSVRDGVQEYYGVELGIEPKDKTFSVYRSPETITAMVKAMDSLPIINDHIDPSLEPTSAETIGRIEETEIVELEDNDLSSSLALENKVTISDGVLKLKDEGKKEFSLGYLGKMREHSDYDFEQYDLKPMHLALVDSARGGTALTFIDKKVVIMNKKFKKGKLDTAFTDAEGTVNLERVVEIATALPEAMKRVPLDQLQKMIPMFEEMMKAAGGDTLTPDVADVEGMDESEEPDDSEKPDDSDTPDNMVDEDVEYQDMEEEDKEKFSDSKLYKSLVKLVSSKSFVDSSVFRDAVKAKVQVDVAAHVAIVAKAKDFLDEDYNFTDANSNKVMRDAIATQKQDKFEDSELSIAFKMLTKGAEYKGFGDSNKDEFDELKNKEF